MTKVTIEIDIPAGRSVAEAEAAVKRAFDDKWLASWWHLDDVIIHAEDMMDIQLTEDEAYQVLSLMERRHDAEVGINWDVIGCWVDYVVSQRAVHKNDCQEFLGLSGSEEYLDDPAILLNIIDIGEKS